MLNHKIRTFIFALILLNTYEQIQGMRAITRIIRARPLSSAVIFGGTTLGLGGGIYFYNRPKAVVPYSPSIRCSIRIPQPLIPMPDSMNVSKSVNETSSSFATKPVAHSETTIKPIKKGMIKLPSKEVIRERLNKLGLKHYVEKTKIDEILANRAMYPIGVVASIDLSFHDYSKDTVDVTMAGTLLVKEEIISELLQDYPKELADLKKQGLLE